MTSSNEFNEINTLATECWQKEDYENAILYWEKLTEMLQDVGNKHDEALVLNNIGASYGRLSKFDKAMECFQEALDIGEEIKDDDIKITAMKNLKNFHFALRDIEGALKYQKEILPLVKSLPNKQIYRDELISSGLLCEEIENFDDTLNYLQLALTISKEINDKDSMLDVFYLLGTANKKLGKFNDAIINFTESLTIAKSLKSKNRIALILAGIGISYFYLDQLYEAVSYCIESLKEGDRFSFEKNKDLALNIEGNPRDVSSTLMNKAQNFMFEGHLDKALPCYIRCLELAKGIKDLELEAVNYCNLGTLCKTVDLNEHALIFFHKSWSTVKDGENYEVKMYNCMSLCDIYFDMKNFPKSIEFQKKGVEFAKKTGNKKYESIMNQLLMRIYDSLGDKESILNYLYEQLELIKCEDDIKREAQILSDIGTFYRQLGRLEEALKNLNASREIFLRMKDDVGVARTSVNIANVYNDLRDHKSAKTYCEEALRLHTKLDSYALIRCNQAMGNTLYSSGNYNEALRYYETAAHISKETYDRSGFGLAYGNMGLAHYKLGDYRKGQFFCNIALEIAIELNDYSEASTNLLRLTEIYYKLGELTKATATQEKSLNIAVILKNKREQADILSRIGINYYKLGDYQTDLKYQFSASKIFRELGDERGIAGSNFEIGVVYSTLKEFERAKDYLNQALEFYRKSEDKTSLAKILGEVAIVYEEFDLDSSLQHFKESESLLKELSDKETIIVTDCNIGKLYLEKEDYEKSKLYFEKALDVCKELDDDHSYARAYCGLGTLYSYKNEYIKSLNYLKKSLDYLKKSPVAAFEMEIIVRYHLAKAYKNSNRATNAIHELEKAVKLIESQRSAFQIEEIKTFFVEDKMLIYKELLSLLIDTGELKKAFHIAERAKARTFLDQIGNKKIGTGEELPKSILENIEELQSRMNYHHTIIMELSNRIKENMITGIDKILLESWRDEIKTSEQELDKAQQDYENLMTEVKMENPEYATLKQVDPLFVEELQNIIDEKTIILEYLVCTDQIAIFIITKNLYDVACIPVKKQNLVEDTINFREMITHFDSELWEKAVKFYDLLIEPIADYLNPNYNICIVPHDILHYLPFHAFMKENKFFAESFSIFYLPSATLLKFCFEKNKFNKQTILAIGNPDLTLIHSETETKEIASLFSKSKILIRQDATKSNVIKLSNQFDILHFSTHGVVNYKKPTFSYLKMAADSGSGDRLEVHEIFNMRLNAYLVSLSACSTGMASISRGDEVSSLGRAFIYAGTPSVLNSLWEVDDKSTSILMTNFYKNLQNKNKVEALRYAQMDMIKSKQYYHPFYWAGFILMGDYK